MSHTTDFLFPIVAASAGAVVSAVVLLQTDFVSRQLLDPSRLSAKRRNEYQYHWKTALEKAHLQLDWYIAGGVSNLSEDGEIVSKQFDYLSSVDEMESLIQRILKETSARFQILKLDRDPLDPIYGDFYLFLIDLNSNRYYQVPLMAFGVALAEAFEDQLTTTTFCFMADASCGKATHLLEVLVKESKTGVAVVSEPTWMVELARLIEANLFTSRKVEKLLFALCRLEAQKLQSETKVSRTVLITLPGQATTATLLPLVQKVFPEDRHVFGYDGCVASVQRGALVQQQYRRGDRQDALPKLLSGVCQNPIRHTTPLPSHSPLTKKLMSLEKALQSLPYSHAQVVETWMASVDAFFQLKEEDNSNGYLPYVWKMTFLTQPVDPNFTPKSDSHWSLLSLLQYVTGHRSQGLSEGVVDAACRFLEDYNAASSSSETTKQPSPLTPQQSKVIENCVFQHKSILIGNKTLQDTVLPTQHWTLKQASKKGGCACCGPDPYDELEEEEEARNQQANGGDTMSVPGAFAMASKPSTKTTSFVDGKLGFAFDPSRFS
jgi:hypothetical protein